ncbi:MAG TPA: response regulator [Anaerolineales bacterium]|nr:response regulator [Anaerolineales bacterium]
MKKVWIIDDDEEMVGAIQLMLQLLGCESERFYSARPAAQTLMQGQAPDLVILDLNMPEVSGIDFLEFVRRREDWKDVPIIILSTEAADVMVDRAMDLGADGYVTKPVAINELEAVMQKAFGAHGKQ